MQFDYGFQRGANRLAALLRTAHYDFRRLAPVRRDEAIKLARRLRIELPPLRWLEAWDR